jgi:hypothetical protein
MIDARPEARSRPSNILTNAVTLPPPATGSPLLPHYRLLGRRCSVNQIQMRSRGCCCGCRRPVAYSRRHPVPSFRSFDLSFLTGGGGGEYGRTC